MSLVNSSSFSSVVRTCSATQMRTPHDVARDTHSRRQGLSDKISFPLPRGAAADKCWTRFRTRHVSGRTRAEGQRQVVDEPAGATE